MARPSLVVACTLIAAVAACRDASGPEGRVARLVVRRDFPYATYQNDTVPVVFGVAGAPLVQHLFAVATDAAGIPVASATVTATVAGPRGGTTTFTARTDSAGVALLQWTLAADTGLATGIVRAGSATAAFRALGFACGTSDSAVAQRALPVAFAVRRTDCRAPSTIWYEPTYGNVVVWGRPYRRVVVDMPAGVAGFTATGPSGPRDVRHAVVLPGYAPMAWDADVVTRFGSAEAAVFAAGPVPLDLVGQDSLAGDVVTLQPAAVAPFAPAPLCSLTMLPNSTFDGALPATCSLVFVLVPSGFADGRVRVVAAGNAVQVYQAPYVERPTGGIPRLLATTTAFGDTLQATTGKYAGIEIDLRPSAGAGAIHVEYRVP